MTISNLINEHRMKKEAATQILNSNSKRLDKCIKKQFKLTYNDKEYLYENRLKVRIEFQNDTKRVEYLKVRKDCWAKLFHCPYIPFISFVSYDNTDEINELINLIDNTPYTLQLMEKSSNEV